MGGHEAAVPMKLAARLRPSPRQPRGLVERRGRGWREAVAVFFLIKQYLYYTTSYVYKTRTVAVGTEDRLTITRTRDMATNARPPNGLYVGFSYSPKLNTNERDYIALYSCSA